MLNNKVIAVGVTGGIAAYKAAEIVSRLRKLGAEVYCVMTEGAKEFITPLTLQTLSCSPVMSEMFSEPKQWNVEHIALADKADVFAIVPATANIVGKMANGIADDLLSTTVMATRASVIIAPAMNVHMYENLIVQENLAKLKRLGYIIIDPAEGNLACGYCGKGKLAEVDDIVNEIVHQALKSDELRGKKVLVTAGPTQETIDPVRYITNHSTGKMGYAIAEQAYLKGAEVLLISGKTNLKTPNGVKKITVLSALDMYNEVMSHYKNYDIIIKTAAVADYRPKNPKNIKIKKQPGDFAIELERNPDILAEIGKNKGDKILVGFAAESNDVIAYATKKSKEKNLDFIVANDISDKTIGFGVDNNQVSIVNANGEVENLNKMDKQSVAKEIINRVAQLLI